MIAARSMLTLLSGNAGAERLFGPPLYHVVALDAFVHDAEAAADNRFVIGWSRQANARATKLVQ